MQPLTQKQILGYTVGDLGINLNFQLIGFYLAADFHYNLVYIAVIDFSFLYSCPAGKIIEFEIFLTNYRYRIMCR